MPEVAPFNPLRIFKFKIYFTDSEEPIAGVSKMGALKTKNESISWRTGGHIRNSASQIPGGSTFEPVTFEAGLGIADGRLQSWAFAVSNWKEMQAGHLPDKFRKDLRVDVLELSGIARISFLISSAWVSEMQVSPELDANNLNTIGLQSFTVQHEGWTIQT